MRTCVESPVCSVDFKSVLVAVLLVATHSLVGLMRLGTGPHLLNYPASISLQPLLEDLHKYFNVNARHQTAASFIVLCIASSTLELRPLTDRASPRLCILNPPAQESTHPAVKRQNHQLPTVKMVNVCTTRRTSSRVAGANNVTVHRR